MASGLPGYRRGPTLSMINVIIEENLCDYDFVSDWTTAPFLIRHDTGNFLRASDLTESGDPTSYMMLDAFSKKAKAYIPGTKLTSSPIIDASQTLKLSSGEKVECSTAFRLLRKSVSDYSPNRAQELTGVPENKIRDAARLLATLKPACWYSWNGIEENINASQTNRAINILYALTGNYDIPGGNVVPSRLPTNPIDGHEFLDSEVEKKRLGAIERPLGGEGMGIAPGEIKGYEAYRAIVTGKPYPIKALLGFGGHLITSSAPTLAAREALSRLDFCVIAEQFLTPAAALADIVLPAASSWESWHVGFNVQTVEERVCIQLRPAVVPPQHESWPDMKIAFELAKRLGLGGKFWDGDIEAAFNYQLGPLNITVEQLRRNPGGIFLNLPMEYQKFSKTNNSGKFRGFPTPSGRIEIYSSLFKDHGYDPLPTWKRPSTFRFARKGSGAKYPLILINGKVIQYCNSQHRALPSLRKQVPHPFLEINPSKAKELGCKDGDWVILETPHGSITVQAKLTEGIDYNVVCTQNGWWQGCPELGLLGYDPYSPSGANVNLLYSDEK